MSLRDTITTDYQALKNAPMTKSTLSGNTLQGAISYAKDELRKAPTDPTLQAWLTIIAEREMDNFEVKGQLEELKDLLDASGKRIIPAPVIDRSINIAPNPIRATLILSEEEKKKMIATKIEVERNIRSSLTGSDLLANLEAIGKLTDPLSRHFGMQYIWGQLIGAGYSINILNNKIELLPVRTIEDAARTTELERALSTSLERGIVSRADIEQSIIIGTGAKLKSYLDTTAKGGNVSTESYTKYLLESYAISGTDSKTLLTNVERNTAISIEEKAYLRSSLGGAMRQLDMPKLANTYTQAVQAGVDLFSSDTYKAIAPLVGNTTPKTPAEAQALAQALASNPNTPTTADGKPISWLVGGILAIFGLGYSKAGGFDFWTGLKRAFIGVVAIVAGCAVGKEWKGELGFDVCEEAKKMAKEAMGKGKEAIAGAVAGTKTAAQEAAEKAKKLAGDTDKKEGEKKVEEKKPNETPSQKIASDKIRGNSDIQKLIASAQLPGKQKNAPLERYLEFINTDLKEKNVGIFLKSVNNNDNTIFANNQLLDPSISLPLDFDPVIFKSIMRMYITGTYMSSVKMNDPANITIITNSIQKIIFNNTTLSQAVEQIQK